MQQILTKLGNCYEPQHLTQMGFSLEMGRVFAAMQGFVLEALVGLFLDATGARKLKKSATASTNLREF